MHPGQANASRSRLRRLVESLPVPRGVATQPIKVMDVELSEPLPPLDSGGYAGAHLAVRLHGQPLGSLSVGLTAGPVSPDELQRLVDQRLGDSLRSHLLRDGLLRAEQQAAPGARHRCLRDLDPPSPPPLVSVVIPTRNRHRQLAECLESLMRVDYEAFEVIVVDNGPSDDSTRAMVREMFGDDARLRYIREDRPGASRARNIGAAASGGEFVAFTDDDTLVDPLWLTALVAGFSGYPRVVCVSGLTLPMALETSAQQAFELYGGMGRGDEARVYDLQENRGATLLYPYTAGVFGASNNVAFRRREFLDKGGFDPTLGPGTATFAAEDLDLFLRIIMAGDRIAYQPAASIRHAHRDTFPDLYWQVFTYSAGFTALLTKWALSDRRTAIELARRVPRLLPAALVHAHRSGSEAGVGKYPSEVRWCERVGYLYGPISYAASRASARLQRTPRATSADAYI